ncbi:MAG: hypothetical protein GY696_12600 [Gammaproteobacteria bacterium]|nr:hypothetical protein [Gammaproteobacteria bacterium]
MKHVRRELGLRPKPRAGGGSGGGSAQRGLGRGPSGVWSPNRRGSPAVLWGYATARVVRAGYSRLISCRLYDSRARQPVVVVHPMEGLFRLVLEDLPWIWAEIHLDAVFQTLKEDVGLPLVEERRELVLSVADGAYDKEQTPEFIDGLEKVKHTPSHFMIQSSQQVRSAAELPNLSASSSAVCCENERSVPDRSNV